MPELRITPDALRHDIAATREAKREEVARHKARIKELDAHEKWLQTALDLNRPASTNGDGGTNGERFGSRKHRPGTPEDYRRYVLNALDRETPRTLGQITEIAGISYASVHNYVYALVEDGEAKVIAKPGQRRNRKFVRAEVRIRPGEGVKDKQTNGVATSVK
jgi:hypothetical protein